MILHACTLLWVLTDLWRLAAGGFDQGASRLGSWRLQRSVGWRRCQWMHLQDPEAQVGCLLEAARSGAENPAFPLTGQVR